MDSQTERQEFEVKLAKCRELARTFLHGSIAEMIRDLTEELEQRIRELEKR
jgi:hypothetical protein